MNIHELLNRQDEIMKFVGNEVHKLKAIANLNDDSTVEGRRATLKAMTAILENTMEVLSKENWEATE